MDLSHQIAIAVAHARRAFWLREFDRAPPHSRHLAQAMVSMYEQVIADIESASQKTLFKHEA